MAIDKNNTTTGERIKALRDSKGMTLDELSKYVGVTRQTLSRYETGVIGAIPSDKIELLAHALDTTPAALMGWDVLQHAAYEMEQNREFNALSFADRDKALLLFGGQPDILPPPQTVKKPRLGTIACGQPILAVENFDGYDDVPASIHCDFTLICKGDSMIGARIHDGDVVYIRQQPEVENGQIAAVLIDGTETTLKRVYLSEGIVSLVAENPEFAPIVITKERQFCVLGKAVGFTSLIR